MLLRVEVHILRVGTRNGYLLFGGTGIFPHHIVEIVRLVIPALPDMRVDATSVFRWKDLKHILKIEKIFKISKFRPGDLIICM